MTQVVVQDAPDRDRYEARDGEELIGVLDYRRTPSTIMLDHVEVIPARRGQGIADLIVSKAVNEARAANLEVVPICSYAVAWLAHHSG